MKDDAVRSSFSLDFWPEIRDPYSGYSPNSNRKQQPDLELPPYLTDPRFLGWRKSMDLCVNISPFVLFLPHLAILSSSFVNGEGKGILLKCSQNNVVCLK